MNNEIIARYEKAVTKLLRELDELDRLHSEYHNSPSLGLAMDIHHTRMSITQARQFVRMHEGPMQVALAEIES